MLLFLKLIYTFLEYILFQESIEKIFLTNEDIGLTVQELMIKYNLPKATAWRAKNRGYFWKDYHKREINISDGEIDYNKIEQLVKKGIASSVKMLMSRTGFSSLKEFMSPYSIEDVEQEAMLRVLQLTGHSNFSNDGFIVNVAKNVVRSFFQKYLKKHSV